MKYKVAVIGTRGRFTKEEIKEILTTSHPSFFTFLICLKSDFEMSLAEIVLEIMHSECKYGLEVIIPDEPHRLSERHKNIAREADSYLIVKIQQPRFMAENCVAVHCFDIIGHSLIDRAEGLHRPVWHHKSK